MRPTALPKPCYSAEMQQIPVRFVGMGDDHVMKLWMHMGQGIHGVVLLGDVVVLTIGRSGNILGALEYAARRAQAAGWEAGMSDAEFKHRLSVFDGKGAQTLHEMTKDLRLPYENDR